MFSYLTFTEIFLNNYVKDGENGTQIKKVTKRKIYAKWQSRDSTSTAHIHRIQNLCLIVLCNSAFKWINKMRQP